MTQLFHKFRICVRLYCTNKS